MAGFLRAWLDQRRERGQPLSYRAAARHLGEASAGVIHAVCVGDRRCTAAMVDRWLPRMDLRPSEAALLLALTQAEEAEAEARRRAHKAAVQPSPDALAQSALAAEAAAAARAVLPALRQAQQPVEAPRVRIAQAGLDGPDLDLPLLAASAQRAEDLLCAPLPPGQAVRAVYGLTEATCAHHRDAIRALFVAARANALALASPGGTLSTFVLQAFPLTRQLAAEAPRATPSPTPSPAGAYPDIHRYGASDQPEAVVPFLRDWLAWRKGEEPLYTQAQFARDADQPDPRILSKLLHGGQRLTPARALQFAGRPEGPVGMGLTDEEARFFAALAARDRAQGQRRAMLQAALDQERALARSRSPAPSRVMGFTSHLPWTLLELRSSPAYRPDPAWLGAALIPPAPPDLVGDVLHQLGPGDPGQVRRIEWELQAPPGGAHVTPVTRYHQAMKALGRRAFAHPAPEDPATPRCGLVLTAPISRWEALADLTRSLWEQLRGRFAEEAGPRDQVMQLNLHAWVGPP